MLTHSLDCYLLDHEITARFARTAAFGFSIPNAAPGPVPAGAAVLHLQDADAIEVSPPMAGRLNRQRSSISAA